MEDPCDFCPAFLSPVELGVIDHMSDGEIVRPASYTAADLGLPVDAVRAAIKRLREIGLARWGNLTDEDGRLAGRGTWLNGAGCALQTMLRRAAGPDPVEREIERAWIIELVRLHKGDRSVMAWAWSYAYRGGQ